MSGISFNEVPANARVPGVYIEIDNSLANNAEDLQRILIIAPKGNADANVVKPTIIPDNAKEIFGDDSVAHKMVSALFTQTKALPIYTIGVDGTDISSALAAVGDDQYHYIFSSFNDKDNIDRLANFLQERYHALQQIPGLGFVVHNGTHAENITFASQFNSPFISILGINSFAGTDEEVLARYYGQCANSLAIDPARPLQTLQMLGEKSTASTEWGYSERNLSLYSGVSTYRSNDAKDCFVERPITTYKENNAGAVDDSYLDITTPATAMFFRAKQRSMILSKYPRHKLAKDGTNFAPGQAVMTPSIAKSELLALYKELEYRGIVQDYKSYAQSIFVEIDATNPTRLNVVDSPVFVNGLQIYAGKNSI
jgi:phage tail sheath gpL-like